jgi:hypothetical protein
LSNFKLYSITNRHGPCPPFGQSLLYLPKAKWLMRATADRKERFYNKYDRPRISASLAPMPVSSGLVLI